MKKIVTYTLFEFCLFISGQVLSHDQPMDLGIMDVIAVTPVQSSGMATDKIPATIQTVTSEQLENAQSVTVAEYINRYLGSVHINEAQNNPLQPDIAYRGFVASPLLGLPQGLSTYVNGVRFNEAFGDTVNWDLLSEGVIDSMALYSGSNPVYGLNSLGGAISIKTKTGFSAPKHQFEAYGGAWDRQSEELSSGWNNGTWGYFINLHHFNEVGWRDFSPTKADQVFSTLSWRGDRGSLDLTLAGNDNKMRGNGAAPIQLLQLNRSAVFTHPDQTVTRMFFSELSGSYDLSDTIELSGNTYFRQNRIRTFNGDNSNYSACDSDNALLCDQDGIVAYDTDGNPIFANDSVMGATNNSSRTNIRSRGGTLQVAFADDWFKHENNLTVGTSYDYAEAHFASDTELAALTGDRGTTHSGFWVDDSRVRLHTNSSTVGVFLTDNFSITDALVANVAGRYNYIHINMADQYIKDPLQNLNGSHTFDRLNPSAGLTYRIRENLTTYGNYSESARAPTPMELSCADPAAPCKLPNSFVSDPPLHQVVAKTWEGGFRGNLDNMLGKGDWRWNLGYFNTINHDDIVFRRDASGGIISQGYFSNIGKTRRYGIEASSTVNYPQLFSQHDDWHFTSHYTYLNARFLDGFDIQNPLDPSQLVSVKPGDRIPSIPEHIYKASVGVDLWQRLTLGIDGIYSGNKFFRGDEANMTRPITGYWLFNARAEYKLSKQFALFGKLDNIFDNHYHSFGVYGQANEILPGFNDGRFLSPGSPRAGWIGVRLTL